jgi:hypothetical protein
LLLIVEDINDNTPVFRPYRTSLTLSEASRPGVIESIEAFDSDEGRFGQVLYEILVRNFFLFIKSELIFILILYLSVIFRTVIIRNRRRLRILSLSKQLKVFIIKLILNK